MWRRATYFGKGLGYLSAFTRRRVVVELTVTLICLNAHISVFGDILSMPYWTRPEEQRLRGLVEQDKSIEELSAVFNRSPEALVMKLKRMSLSVPPRGKSSAKNEENKVTTSATTTTPKLEPIEFEELPSPNMAMGLLWAAVRRLQEPDVSREEAKKLRLILQ